MDTERFYKALTEATICLNRAKENQNILDDDRELASALGAVSLAKAYVEQAEAELKKQWFKS